MARIASRRREPHRVALCPLLCLKDGILLGFELRFLPIDGGKILLQVLRICPLGYGVAVLEQDEYDGEQQESFGTQRIQWLTCMD